MIGKIIIKSLKGNKAQKSLSFLTIALASILISTMLNITLGISNEVTKELRSYGSNIVVLPNGSSLSIEVGDKTYTPLKNTDYLDESNIYTIKEIFWRNNITAFAPFLDVKVSLNDNITATLVGTYFAKNVPIDGESDYTTGVLSLFYFWKFEGKATTDDSLTEVNIGRGLANKYNLKLDDTIKVNDYEVKIVGIVDFAGEYDDKIISSLKFAQKILGKDNVYSKAEVSALTIPNDDLSQKARHDLSSLDSLEQDKWYCSAYADTIAYQINEDYKGANAKVLTKVADAESKVTQKIQSLMAVISIICLVVASIAIASLMSSDIFKRKKEIGLLKALGANNLQIYIIFAGESIIVSIFGAIFGVVCGLLISEIIAYSIFSHMVPINFIIFPIAIVFSVLISVLGAFLSMRSVVSFLPAEVLYGRK